MNCWYNSVCSILDNTTYSKNIQALAKKTVATLQEGKKDGRSYTKVIKMVKNPENGAYFFDEKMVPNEAVQDFFKN